MWPNLVLAWLIVAAGTALPAFGAEVTSLADDGPGSFRRAVAGGRLVAIHPVLAGKMVILASTVEVPPGTVVDASVAPGFTLSGGGKVRVLLVKEGTEPVTIRGVTLTAGLAGGKDRDAGAGGGLLSQSRTTLTLQRCTFRTNTARGEGGGGLYTGYLANTVVEDCTFEANDASTCPGERAGGAIATASGGSLTVRRSTFTGNLGGNGAAINRLLGALLVEDCTFTGNRSRGGGTGTDGYGAAIYTDGASLKIDDELGGTIVIRGSRFLANTGLGQGGACFLFAYPPDVIAVERCLFQDNRVEPDGKGDALGGAIRIGNAAATIADSTFSGNVALQQGGALWIGKKSPLKVTNSTFTGNRAGTGKDDEPAKDGLAGVLAAMTDAAISFERCTIADNHASTGGVHFGSGTPTFTRCILSGNDGKNGNGLDGGNNLEWGSSGIFAKPTSNQDPQLGPLLDHGGMVPTRLPADARLVEQIGAAPVKGVDKAEKTPAAKKKPAAPAAKPVVKPPSKALADLVKEGLDAPGRDEALASLRTFLGTVAGPKTLVMAKVGGVAYQECVLVITDDQMARLRRGNDEVTLPWRLLSDEDLVEMVRPLIDQAPANIHANWLFLGIYAGRCDVQGGSFRTLAGKLWTKDKAQAQRVDAALKRLNR